jgi:Putative auto-transporter adhesin, head GIN domain
VPPFAGEGLTRRRVSEHDSDRLGIEIATGWDMGTAKTSHRLALVAAALALCACGDSDHDRSPMGSETRELGAFESISMQGAARLEITVGPTQSVVVEGRERAIGRVTTDVRDGTLYIETRRKDWFVTNSRSRLTLRIAVPKLAALKLEGGNDVRLTGFDGGVSSINVTGAAHIQADGRLDELTVHMAGAGHADFSKLSVNDANVTVDGVGSVIVHPQETLNATMNGVGAILYTGSPHRVNTRMNGLGTIGQRDPKEAGQEDEHESSPGAPDPETLQPERESPHKKPVVDSTEVI